MTSLRADFKNICRKRGTRVKKRKNNFIYDEFTDLLEAYITGGVNFA